MQRDLAAGKQSEIDGLIYEVVRLADKYGLSLSAYRKISEKFWLTALNNEKPPKLFTVDETEGCSIIFPNILF